MIGKITKDYRRHELIHMGSSGKVTRKQAGEIVLELQTLLNTEALNTATELERIHELAHELAKKSRNLINHVNKEL